MKVHNPTKTRNASNKDTQIKTQFISRSKFIYLRNSCVNCLLFLAASSKKYYTADRISDKVFMGGLKFSVVLLGRFRRTLG